ncbi:protein suppressor of hairy wing isoform X1 [Neodiprion pinetum]|uniref:protein suppressor of hairy wing isoform X1 n=2 Tax=Neodiprion pinetum TaxID=441929 RepID=UPI001EDFF5EA|nr:gastrula zinc finger protein xFG20-1-like isoform X1 [Neodiprion pinetum]
MRFFNSSQPRNVLNKTCTFYLWNVHNYISGSLGCHHVSMASLIRKPDKIMDLNPNLPILHGLKTPVVKLERCDNIWKTLQLIRRMQDTHLEDIQDWIKREPVTPDEILCNKTPMTFIPDKTLSLNLIGEPHLPKPYIEYHPILNNGNKSLPQFQLAEKSRVNLYHCEVCSKEFCNYKNFSDHQEEVHNITLPKKATTKKDKFSNNFNKIVALKQRSDSEDSSNDPLNKKFISDENSDLQTVVKILPPTTGSTKCKLCNRSYKNIRKHTIQYHKVKSVGILDTVSDQNSNEPVGSILELERLNSVTLESGSKTVDEAIPVSRQNRYCTNQNNRNISKRKLNMPSNQVHKKMRSMSPREEQLNSENPKNLLSCEICGRKNLHNIGLCKHKDKHKISNEIELQSNVRQTHKSIDFEPRCKLNSETSATAVTVQDDDSNAKQNIPRTRSSIIKERSAFIEMVQNPIVATLEQDAERYSEKQCLCGRSFRNAYILFTHKSTCKFLNSPNSVRPLETRSASDRDSGISITIKKKNNSYEIVSKEGSDEVLFRNNHDAAEFEICDETSDSSSNSSDSSEFDDPIESLVPENSKYSENHCIIKLKVVEEDMDVEIEDLCDADRSSTVIENGTSKIFGQNKRQVLSLRDLCKEFLFQKGVMPKGATTHKCQNCKIFLGSREKLSKHIEKHKKMVKRSCTCGIKFSGIKALDAHIASVHPKCIECPYCKEKLNSIAAVDDHVCIIDQGEPYTEDFNENHPCPNCNIVFNNVTWLDSHMRSKHLDPNFPFQCYQCLEKFPNEMARSIHAHKKHNRGMACSICNEKIQSHRTKQKHEAYHRGVGFPCHTCKKTYRSKANQLNHLRTVHSDFSNNKLQCSICQKSIKTKSFRKHMLRHSSVLQCELCDKVFYDYRTLERHIMDRHSNENYPRKKCNVCGVSFPTEEQLEAHVTVEKSVKTNHRKNM